MLCKALNCIRSQKIKVILCGHVYVAPVAYLIKKLVGIPFCSWIYALELTDKKKMAFLDFILRSASCLIVISEFTKGLLSAYGFDSKKIEIIHPTVDAERFKPIYKDSKALKWFYERVKGKKTILTVSRLDRLSRYKGIDNLIEALPRIKSKIPEILYVIVGSGNDKQYLEELARENGVSGNVFFMGDVSQELLPYIYNSVDIFVLISREEQYGDFYGCEGFGIVLVEAQACGKPVIGGRSGGIPETMKEGVTGLLVNPNRLQKISEAVVSLISNGELSQKMGTAGRMYTIDKFSPQKAVFALGKFLNSIC
jgi:phosphatidylinositol alpha-1,6-mannosyltransferase